MQNQQNLSAHSKDKNESESKSPMKKTSGEQKLSAFKSPLTSGKKGRISKNLINNENIEPEQNNPFSGPVFSSGAKGKCSPGPSTPIKVKEEAGHSDMMGGSRDINMGLRQLESPFTKFCKDLDVSPSKPNLMSPSTLLPGLQYNYGYGNIHNNHYYSPFHDNKDSPAFKRNITKIEFNPSNSVILNTNKDRVNIEPEDSDPLQLHNSHLYDEASMLPYFKFFSNPNQSIYTSSMVQNENYAKRYQEKGDDDDCLSPRTPSPQLHENENVKLETLNSFSAQRKNPVARRENTPNDYNHSGSQGSRARHGRDEVLTEAPSSAKPKKKVCCNCKKSRCLKLYCDCFGRGEPCSKECNCVNCYNNDEHAKERQEAIESIQEKNPSAFKPKIDKTDSPKKIVQQQTVDEQGRIRHMKGCNCKKSGCLKRYCECYQAGVQCTEMCKCENCKNMDSCSRFKRAEKYGLQNFGSHNHLHQLVYAPEAVVYKRKGYNEHFDSEEMDQRYYSHVQDRNRHNHYIDDQRYERSLPTKKRKNEATVYEFTPKRTLNFSKDDNQNFDDNEEEIGERGYNHFATPHVNMEKRSVKMEKIEDYTPSPGKFNLSAKRAKRNVKLYNQFDPEEYELTK